MYRFPADWYHILKAHVDAGNVSVNEHPAGRLRIYNYTPKVQYDRLWDEVTMWCRGLILDDMGYVVARPFPKFFNWGELDEEKQTELYKRASGGETVYVENKFDGSLGILYPHPVTREPQMATRGSFTSEQAQWANEWIAERHPRGSYPFPSSITFLGEIIYPENRIVVDYGGWRGIVHLATINNSTGRNLRVGVYTHMPHGIFVTNNAQHADESEAATDILEGAHEQASGEDAEGYVLRWALDDYRVKVKFEDYVRLHRIVTGTTARTIWEALSTSGQPSSVVVEEIVEAVPEEFELWVRRTARELRTQYINLMVRAFEEYIRIRALDPGDRKAFALEAVKWEHPDLLFMLLDGRPLKSAVWKRLKPKAERPFREDIDG